MDFPTGIIWTIPILTAFLIGLCPKPTKTLSVIALTTLIVVGYFVSCYHTEKQSVLLIALLMALPYVIGLIILATMLGARIRKLENKKFCKFSVLLVSAIIICLTSYSIIEIFKIRKEKYLIEHVIKIAKTEPRVLKEVGENPKAVLFNQNFNSEDDLNSIEIRVTGKKVLYVIIDVNKKTDTANFISLKCITPLAPSKRKQNYSCLE